MTDQKTKTVKELFGVCCPECGHDDSLVCDAVVYAHYTPHGLHVEPDAFEDITPMDDTWINCQHCDYGNTEAYFKC